MPNCILYKTWLITPHPVWQCKVDNLDQLQGKCESHPWWAVLVPVWMLLVVGSRKAGVAHTEVIAESFEELSRHREEL